MNVELWKEEGRPSVIGYMLFASIFFLFLTFTVISWQNNLLLEDNDSVTYVMQAQAVMDGDWRAIVEAGPDATPVYPLFSGLMAFLSGEAEFGARFASFLASTFTFFLMIVLGYTLGLSTISVAAGLLFFTVNPYFIELSYSVLSEPTYVAIIILGTVVFLRALNKLTLSSAALTGAIFGLSFLCRTEGILYLAALPGIILLFYGIRRLSNAQFAYNHSFKTTVKWGAVFILSFSVLAAPQIAKVSYQMGYPLINGRQIWMKVLTNEDGLSYNEKIYGLHYDAGKINLVHLQENPGDLNASAGGRLKLTAKNVIRNYNRLMSERIPMLIGTVAIGLLTLGLYSIFAHSSSILSACIITMLMLVALVGPLLHNVQMRHLAPLAPGIFLLMGLGSTFLTNVLTKNHLSGAGKYLRIVVLVGICGLLLMQFALPLRKMYWHQETYNNDYEPAKIDAIVSQYIGPRYLNAARPVIASRKGYLPLAANADWKSLPYTDYMGLVEYCRLNDIDLIFINHRQLRKFPFLEKLQNLDSKVEHNKFNLVFETIDSMGDKLSLYEVKL